MNIRAITFTPIRGGPQEGICTAWVVFGEGTTLPPSEVVQTIVGFSGRDALRHVTIDGDYASEDADLMFAFVKALRDFGYAVRVHATGQIHPPWFSLATWIVISTDPVTPWLRFACHEVRHRIESPGDPEPPLPANNPVCYVIADTVDNAVAFSRKSKVPWGILVPEGQSFMESIVIQKKGIQLRLEK